MKEPVDHILRSLLPWRAAQFVTECGINAQSVKTLSRDEYSRRLKDLGQQRTALLTCMTCTNTFERYATWEVDPRLAVAREIDWEGAQWNRFSGNVVNHHGTRLRDELLAIAELIERHKAEFAELTEAEEIRRFFAEEGAKINKGNVQ